MTEPAFKVGDVVLLRSGGPSMTIYFVRPHDPPFVYGVEWFDNHELKRDSFSELELICPRPPFDPIKAQMEMGRMAGEAKP